VLSYERAQEFLGVSHQTVYKLVRGATFTQDRQEESVSEGRLEQVDKRALDLSITITLVLFKKFIVP